MNEYINKSVSEYKYHIDTPRISMMLKRKCLIYGKTSGPWNFLLDEKKAIVVINIKININSMEIHLMIGHHIEES